MSQLTAPYGYTPVDNGIFGGTFIIFGVIGSFVFGVILDKTAKFKMILNVICFGSLACICVAFFTLPSGNVPLFTVNLAFIGAFCIPVIPVSYGFAVELTFPVTEAMSNGMMVMFSQIAGTLLVIYLTLKSYIGTCCVLGYWH